MKFLGSIGLNYVLYRLKSSDNNEFIIDFIFRLFEAWNSHFFYEWLTEYVSN